MGDAAEVVTGNGGLKAVKVTGEAGRGLVYLHGGHVAAWAPAGGDEVLWLSAKSHWAAGKPIRGGVPICFPWFGPRAGDPGAPAHGFARLKEWTLEEAQGTTVTLRLEDDEETRRAWGQAFALRMRVTFGRELEMRLELTNRGSGELAAEEALHTYFAVGDVRQTSVRGLDGVRYIDKVDGMKEKMQAGAIRIEGETDRVYVGTRGEVTIEDPSWKGGGRRIVVSKEGSADTVVWNPWVAKAKAMADFGDEEWPGMICVETCNVMAHAVRVAAGETKVMTARVRVERLPG
jgi:D-hexose-6-phosphate mutarotase